MWAGGQPLADAGRAAAASLTPHPADEAVEQAHGFAERSSGQQRREQSPGPRVIPKQTDAGTSLRSQPQQRQQQPPMPRAGRQRRKAGAAVSAAQLAHKHVSIVGRVGGSLMDAKPGDWAPDEDEPLPGAGPVLPRLQVPPETLSRVREYLGQFKGSQAASRRSSAASLGQRARSGSGAGAGQVHASASQRRKAGRRATTPERSATRPAHMGRDTRTVAAKLNADALGGHVGSPGMSFLPLSSNVQAARAMATRVVALAGED